MAHIRNHGYFNRGFLLARNMKLNQIGTTYLAKKLAPVCNYVAKGNTVTVTHGNTTVGHLIPLATFNKISLAGRVVKPVPSEKFRDKITDYWYSLGTGTHCLVITKRGRNRIAFVNPEIWESVKENN